MYILSKSFNADMHFLFIRIKTLWMRLRNGRNHIKVTRLNKYVLHLTYTFTWCLCLFSLPSIIHAHIKTCIHTCLYTYILFHHPLEYWYFARVLIVRVNKCEISLQFSFAQEHITKDKLLKSNHHFKIVKIILFSSKINT